MSSSFLPRLAARGLFLHCSCPFYTLTPTMASRQINLLNLVAASVHAANEAGKIVRDVMRQGDLAIVDKGINDLQTEADRSAQRAIISCISQSFPTVAIIGEETLSEEENNKHASKGEPNLDQEVLKYECPAEWSSVADGRIVVWVDPLDGTSEYTQGFLDHVTVLIGIAVDGKAVAGVICQPYENYQNDPQPRGRTIWAIVGLGVFGIKRTDAPRDQLIIVTTRSHGSKAVNDSLEALQPCQVMRVGGAGHKVLLVIEGRAHAYVFPSAGSKKWDTCAPEAVLRATGGLLTDIHGNNLEYHKMVNLVNDCGVLAAIDKQVFDKCVKLIPLHVKQQLLPKHSL